MTEPAQPARPGFTYHLSDEVLARFAQSTLLQRLQWLEEMRTMSWHTASEATRAEWKRLRAHPPPRGR